MLTVCEPFRASRGVPLPQPRLELSVRDGRWLRAEPGTFQFRPGIRPLPGSPLGRRLLHYGLDPRKPLGPNPLTLSVEER